MTEYALLIALIAIAAIVGLMFMGQQISAVMSQLGSMLGTPAS